WQRTRGPRANEQARRADGARGEKQVLARQAPSRAHDVPAVADAERRHRVPVAVALFDRDHVVQGQDLDAAGRLGHGEIVVIETALGPAVEAVKRLPGDGGGHAEPANLVAHDVPVDRQVDRARRESRGPGLVEAHPAGAVVLRRQYVVGDGRRANDPFDARIVHVLHLAEVDLSREDALEELTTRLHDDGVEDERAPTHARAGADEDAIADTDLEDADVQVDGLLELRQAYEPFRMCVWTSM